MSRHDAGCARRLRAGMLAKAGAVGVSPLMLEALASTIMRCCGHRPLKAHRLAHGWTIERAVAAFRAMCQEQGLAPRGLTIRSWLEWEAGEHPNADYRDLLCQLFGTDPVSLGLIRGYAGGDAGPVAGQAGNGNDDGFVRRGRRGRRVGRAISA